VDENSEIVDNMTTEIENGPLAEHIMGLVVNCANLNIRKAPNREAEVLCIVKVDSFLGIEAILDAGWARVQTEDGTIGYAMTEFIGVF